MHPWSLDEVEAGSEDVVVEELEIDVEDVTGVEDALLLEVIILEDELDMVESPDVGVAVTVTVVMSALVAVSWLATKSQKPIEPCILRV